MINPNDAHAVDIRCHKKCWLTHVTNNVLRGIKDEEDEKCALDEAAAKIEFLTLIDEVLSAGNIVNMASFEETYSNILLANNVKDPKCNRKNLKRLLLSNIPGSEFYKPKKVSESERCCNTANRRQCGRC